MGTKELIIERIKELQKLVDEHKGELFKEDENFAIVATCFFIDENNEWNNEVVAHGFFKQIEISMATAMCEHPWLMDRAISAMHYANKMRMIEE